MAYLHRGHRTLLTALPIPISPQPDWSTYPSTRRSIASSSSSSTTIRRVPPPSYADSLPDSVNTFPVEDTTETFHHPTAGHNVDGLSYGIPVDEDMRLRRPRPSLSRGTSETSQGDDDGPRMRPMRSMSYDDYVTSEQSTPPPPVTHNRTFSHSTNLLPFSSLPTLSPPPLIPLHYPPSLPTMNPPHPSSLQNPSSIPSSSSSTAIAPPLTFPFPKIDALLLSAPTLDSSPEPDRLAWAQDVLRILEKHKPSDGISKGSSRPIPSALTSLLQQAVPIILEMSKSKDASLAARAGYLKATLMASGTCELVPKDPRTAFKEFEIAAKGGEVRGWFTLGRDYESVGDVQRAKDCFERGKNKADGECTYRLGMAHLLGQLSLPSNPDIALPLLSTAADLATIDAPHLAYVYGMLLANELEIPQPLPSHLVLPADSPPETIIAQHVRAKEAIERAAYLCHPAAQYKMGYIYEHAALGSAYDPLMSVQWYSLASQGREVEADMALSKWFLCGAEPHFAKNEELARTFAEKAARKGHPNGCFAMGYYYELGIGGRKDIVSATKWYNKAAKLQNTDAIARLAALAAPVPRAISMQEHETHVQDTLVRKRTAAKIRSDRTSIHRPAQAIVQRRRQEESLRLQADSAARAAARDVPPVQQGEPIFSPNPRPGEIMATTQRYLTPLRMPVPSREPQRYVNNGEHLRPSRSPGLVSPRSGDFPISASIPGRDGNRVYALQDSRVGNVQGVFGGREMDERERERERIREIERERKEGPQTFAEMGFVSKPVEDDGCVVM
ncbi:hypothetical protein M231_02747 [Tremella mesenterica]|uniref:Enzyme activator n=1 Tax=Tremella mesenterica TaxID=5217 RepID=A0A4Q1BQ78_TREME|nr:hypothetical protein M231_02747 [Tremella mesenterica]